MGAQGVLSAPALAAPLCVLLLLRPWEGALAGHQTIGRVQELQAQQNGATGEALKVMDTNGMKTVHLEDLVPAGGFRKPPVYPRFGRVVLPHMLHGSARPDDDGVEPEGAYIESCSTGFLDTADDTTLKVPLNCPVRYTLGASLWLELHQRMRSHTVFSISKFEKAFLAQHDDLACGQRIDFLTQPAWQFQIFRIQNALLTSDGMHLFHNRTIYNYLMCIKNPPEIKYKRVVDVGEEAINLAHIWGHNFYHTLIDEFPLFIATWPLLHRQIPILVTAGQVPFMRKTLTPLLGISFEDLAQLHVMEPNTLYTAKNFYQPLHQGCMRSSKSLWRHIRREHLLKPNGVPVFRQGWFLRPAPAGDVASLSSDWVVVIERRRNRGPRYVQGMEEVIEKTKQLFSEERVVVRRGGMGILAARELYMRAKLFIAGHGAGLANIIFMPPGSSVLEIRPDGDAEACYHALANACSVDYYMVFGKGFHHTEISINVTEVMAVVKTLAGKLLGLQ